MEERRQALEVNGHGHHAPPLAVRRGTTSERATRAVGPGDVPERSRARSLDASRTDAPLRKARAACRSGGLDGAFAVIGRSQVGSRSVGSSRRTVRRRYAEGPTKVAGGAGRRAAEGAPARAGYRAGTPLHRPPPSRGEEVEIRSHRLLAPWGSRRPRPFSGRISGCRFERPLGTGHPRRRPGAPVRWTTATRSVPAVTVVPIRRAWALRPSVLGAASPAEQGRAIT